MGQGMRGGEMSGALALVVGARCVGREDEREG